MRDSGRANIVHNFLLVAMESRWLSYTLELIIALGVPQGGCSNNDQR